MITHDAIADRLRHTEAVHHVQVDGDGYHYEVTVVSDVFKDKKTLARQQWVYRQLHDWITDGSLHAIRMHTYTLAEWEKKHG